MFLWWWIPGIWSYVGGPLHTWVPILNPDGGAVVLRVEGTLGHAAVQPRNVLVAAKVRQVRVDYQILCNRMGLVGHRRSAVHSQKCRYKNAPETFSSFKLSTKEH